MSYGKLDQSSVQFAVPLSEWTRSYKGWNTMNVLLDSENTGGSHGDSKSGSLNFTRIESCG